MAKKKKPLPPLKRLLSKRRLRWKLLPLKRLRPLKAKLLPLLKAKLLPLKPLLLKPLPPLSNPARSYEKPALGPVFLCLQETVEPLQGFGQARQGLGVGEAEVA